MQENQETNMASQTNTTLNISELQVEESVK